MTLLTWLNPDFVESLFHNQRLTIGQVQECLESLYPNARGLSVRSLKRYMQENDIYLRSSVSDEELREQVRIATMEVGGVLGRKKMQGYIRGKGVAASQQRITALQQEIAPIYAENRRKDLQRQVNPQPYYAPHFGYNIHFDQNEKLVEFGIVFVIAVDGKSSFITRGAVMPRKNNITIYQLVYGPSTEQYGLWDQLIADAGKEFLLAEFVQEYMKQLRIKPDGSQSTRDSFRQIRSTQNNRVERLWQEVNQMVGYPMKYALIFMEMAYMFDRTNPRGDESGPH
uniref:Integrase catalytic domain-containing protein n=1 Tax=Plectus sambesii TaxID=2011161 RepID=A0A914VR93_9BILA